MKSIVLAAGLLVVGASAASAQYARWDRGAYPYEERHHLVCQEKAFRLHEFERRAARDYVYTPREREIIRELRFDLDRTCGRFRWRG